MLINLSQKCKLLKRGSFTNLKIGILKNFVNSTRKKSVLESLFEKASELKACNFIKKRLQHSCSPVKFAKFLKTHFFYRRIPVKEFGTKVGVIVSNRYQIQLKKSICYRENPEGPTVGVL